MTLSSERARQFSGHRVKALSRVLIRLLNLLAVDDRALTRRLPFCLCHMRRAVPKTNAPFQGVAATTL